MRRKQNRRRSTITCNGVNDSIVVRLRKSEAAIFRRNLDSEKSHFSDTLHHLLGDFARSIGLGWIVIGQKKIHHLFNKNVANSVVLCALLGKWINQIEIEFTGEQFLAKTRMRP